MEKQIELFKQFYAKYKDTEFKQDFNENIFDGDSSYWDVDETIDRCDVCGMIGAEEIYGCYICQDCFEQMLYEKVLEKEQSIPF